MQFAWLARTAVAAMLAVGALSLSSTPGASQQNPTPQTLAAAQELLLLKRGDVAFYPVIDGVVETVKGVFLPMNPNLGKELNEVAQQLRKEYQSKRPELLNEIAKAYAEHFSEAELTALVAFYKTPVGQKMVAEEPKIIDDSVRRSQTWGDVLSGQVLDRFREEMKKRGHTL